MCIVKWHLSEQKQLQRQQFELTTVQHSGIVLNQWEALSDQIMAAFSAQMRIVIAMAMAMAMAMAIAMAMTMATPIAMSSGTIVQSGVLLSCNLLGICMVNGG